MKYIRNFIVFCLRVPAIILCIGLVGYIGWNVDVQASSLDYRAYTNTVEEKYSLPTNLLVAICSYENRSHLWRNVAGGHGEIGVCQIKPDTVRMVCGDCNTDKDVLVFGSTGDNVRIVQRVLGVNVDGIFGKQTLAALLVYQNYHKLKSDGVVGSKTWLKITGKPLIKNSIDAQLWEPKKNIEYAAKYVVWLRNLLGDDESLIIAAYNAGPANAIVTYVKKVKEIRNSYE